MKTATPPFATKLGAIDNMTLSLECRCGRTALVGVVDLLRRHDRETVVSDVLPACRCSGCGQRGALKHVRIIFMLAEHRDLAHTHQRQIEDASGLHRG